MMAEPLRWLQKVTTQALQLMITIYQWTISPYLGKNCRFEPTCSSYALVAIEQHGPIKGVWLTINRLRRCHPWHEGGYDPVPESTKPSHDASTH
jgi:putative membrane protein insertion efficiency factor